MRKLSQARNGIIKRVSHKEHDKIKQISKDLNLRTIEEILRGLIEKEFGKKDH